MSCFGLGSGTPTPDSECHQITSRLNVTGSKKSFAGQVRCLIRTAAAVLVLLASAVASSKQEGKLPPKYRDWLNREAVYIITKDEKATFLQLPTDQDRDNFLE